MFRDYEKTLSMRSNRYNDSFIKAVEQGNTGSMCAFKAMGANCYSESRVVNIACNLAEEKAIPVLNLLFEFGLERYDLVKQYIDNRQDQFKSRKLHAFIDGKIRDVQNQMRTGR